MDKINLLYRLVNSDKVEDIEEFFKDRDDMKDFIVITNVILKL